MQDDEAVKSLQTELEDGTLYLGDWKKGEIQIAGLHSVEKNSYWMDVNYDVLFPPKHGETEPTKGTYRSVRWNAGIIPGAGALCLTEQNEIILVHCFRHTTRSWVNELPRGLKNPDESVVACALREATEECGVVLTDTSEIIDLGFFYPESGTVFNKYALVAFTNVRIDKEQMSLDDSESSMGPIVMSIETFMKAIADGEMVDGWARSAVLASIAKGIIKI